MTHEVVILYYLRVSNHFVWQQRRQVFSKSIIATPEPSPFLTFVLESIDVDGDRCSGQPEDWAERRIGAVANQSCVVTTGNRVNGGKKSVDDCIEVFVPDCRQDFEADAVIFQLSG